MMESICGMEAPIRASREPLRSMTGTLIFASESALTVPATAGVVAVAGVPGFANVLP